MKLGSCSNVFCLPEEFTTPIRFSCAHADVLLKMADVVPPHKKEKHSSISVFAGSGFKKVSSSDDVECVSVRIDVSKPSRSSVFSLITNKVIYFQDNVIATLASKFEDLSFIMMRVSLLSACYVPLYIYNHVWLS